MRLVTGRKNLALTIMVPFNCQNNCPFCESKKEYSKHKPDLEKVISTMRDFFHNNDTLSVPEVVITGGEPMANMDNLRKIISNIPLGKDIYINTSLTNHNFDEFVDLVNNHPQIKGISVSRHNISQFLDSLMLHDIVRDNLIAKIQKPVRINCVLNNRPPEPTMQAVIIRWTGKNVTLSFREDFNTMQKEELHNPYSHESLISLAAKYQFCGNTHCKVCDTTKFQTDKGLTVLYHKGLANTLIPLTDGGYAVNDIILRQDGKIFIDWDFSDEHLLNIADLRKSTRIELNPLPSVSCGSSGFVDLIRINGYCGSGGC